MEWMYKNSTNTVDNEEYLLGRAIDKNFENQLSGTFNEVDKDLTPSSIFSNTGGNLQVDVVRKLKEDPLEQIRQKEIETRKQLLKNPVKLKKLQDILKANRDKEEMILKKKARKYKSQDKEIDQLLTSKFLQVKEMLGGKKLSDIGGYDIERKDKRNSNSYEKEKKKKNKCSETSSPANSSSWSSNSDSDESINEVDKQVTPKKNKFKEKKAPEMKEYRNRSKHTLKKFGLEIRNHSRLPPSNTPTGSINAQESRRLEEKKKKYWQDNAPKRKLTEEEKEERLKQMTENANWRKQLTTKSIKRYKEEKKKEKHANEKDFDKDFFRRQMALATSQTTVHQRIKSNVNNIQRSERHMSENFARR